MRPAVTNYGIYYDYYCHHYHSYLRPTTYKIPPFTYDLLVLLLLLPLLLLLLLLLLPLQLTLQL